VQPKPPPRPPLPWWRRALAALLWTVVALGVGAYLATLLVPLSFQARNQSLMIVTSGSMAPTFDAGDLVVMRQLTDPSQLKVGQIVAFWPVDSNHLVTHKITALHTLPQLRTNPATGRSERVEGPDGKPIQIQYIKTKGDANPTEDVNMTPYTRVRGIVLHWYEGGWGWVLQWATSPAGRATMLVPPLVALATLEVLALHDARRRRSERSARKRPYDELVLRDAD
jgi:signal peptidase